jgi:hypothetical protein
MACRTLLVIGGLFFFLAFLSSIIKKYYHKQGYFNISSFCVVGCLQVILFFGGPSKQKFGR